MSNNKGVVWALFHAVGLSAVLTVGLLSGMKTSCQTPNAGSVTFHARALLAVSDTDMKASAYIDGKLGSFAGEDTLSVFRTGVPVRSMQAATVPASNSVAGPPQSIAVTPDGKTAIIVETWGPGPGGEPEATMKDLAPRRVITVVDVRDLNHPRVVQRVNSFEHALSVSIDKSGALVAVAYDLPSSFDAARVGHIQAAERPAFRADASAPSRFSGIRRPD